ncbi:MAG TPA: hypothetical protein DDY31_02860 [Lachnospiraceae bacterium]|nr:hypothetical protein [Lachnospiraceae bacterium]
MKENKGMLDTIEKGERVSKTATVITILGILGGVFKAMSKTTSKAFEDTYDKRRYDELKSQGPVGRFQL